jgi:hypothetical protein
MTATTPGSGNDQSRPANCNVLKDLPGGWTTPAQNNPLLTTLSAGRKNATLPSSNYPPASNEGGAGFSKPRWVAFQGQAGGGPNGVDSRCTFRQIARSFSSSRRSRTSMDTMPSPMISHDGWGISAFRPIKTLDFPQSLLETHS